MNCHSFVRWPCALIAAGCLFLSAGATAVGQPQLVVTIAVDLADTVGVRSVASGINDLGTVVGTRSPYGLDVAYAWSAETGAVDLGEGSALAVNNRDDVAGHGAWTGTVPQARLWSNGNEVTVAAGIAYSLNDGAAVVGFHYPPSTVYHAFRWTSENGLQDVESLTGATPPWSYFTPHAEARFIRNDGVMTGWRNGLAVVWQPAGAFSELGPGVATSINEGNLAVGATALPPNGHPVIWRATGSTQLSSAIGEAQDVNASGYVVGWIDVGGERHAFLWHESYGLQDMGPGEARQVNDAGRIAGYRTTPQGNRATVWQVNLPTADALTGLEAMARRLAGEDPRKDPRAMLRNLRLARRAYGRSPDANVRRHLERALGDIGVLEGAGELAPAAAEALLKFGRAILASLPEVHGRRR